MSILKKLLIDNSVLSNIEIAKEQYILEIKLKSLNTSEPGQFLELRLKNQKQLLNRPFSILDYESGKIKILYKVRGNVTKEMSSLKEGDLVDIICPLGKGFSESFNKQNIFISGGTGFAPLSFLAKTFNKNNKDIKFLIGGMSIETLEYKKLLPQGVSDVLIATEDGSIGKKCLVTELLNTITDIESYSIYAAGPVAMLREIYNFSKTKKIKTYLSFESHFACGLGFCWGCAIETKDGLLRICKDGPVFDGDSIIWERLRIN